MCFFFAVWSEDMQEEVWELLHYKVNAVNLHQEACSFTLGGNAVILFALLSLLWSVCGISFFQLVNEKKNLLLSLQISHVGVQTAWKKNHLDWHNISDTIKMWW